MSLSLPPEKVQEYFKQKGFQITWNWDEMCQEAHNRSFTVAKVMKEDILKDIRQMVDRAIDEGLTFQQFKKELTPQLQAKGWWGIQEIDGKEVQLGSPYRLKTIYRTNIDVAYSVGRYQELTEQVDFAPYWQYVAVMDARTSEFCRIHNGQVYRYDSPFWNYGYPPNHWGCRSAVRNYTEEDLREKGLKVSPVPDIQTVNAEISGKKVKTVVINGAKMQPEWSYNPGKDYLRVK